MKIRFWPALQAIIKLEGIGTDMNNTMKNKLFTIILVCVLIVAGCSTLITSKMIARGITDDALYNKTHAILIVSSVLTLIALICILIRAIFLLQEHLNK